ncbi:MAG: hypothetical protein OXC60_02115 [Litoreibacter sp.]|nr:hypothetical protein [Litoreibacter sp.]
MSDRVANSEQSEDVEDVLSSIKRLVSNTAHTAETGAEKPEETDRGPSGDSVSKADATGAKPTALLLTSAQRVLPGDQVEQSTLDSLRASVSETIENASGPASTEPEEHPTASLHWIAPSPVSEYYEDEAADDPNAFSPDDVSVAPVKPASAEVLHLTPASKANDQPGQNGDSSAAPEESDLDDAEAFIEPSSDDADLSFDDATTDEVLSPLTEQEPHSEAEAASALHADTDLDPTGVEDETQVSMIDPGWSSSKSDVSFQTDWDFDDLDADDRTSNDANEETWQSTRNSDAHLAAAEAAPEPWDEVVTAGSAPFSREQDDAEVAGIATFVRSGREITYTEVETHELDAELADEELDILEAEPLEDEPDLFDEDLLNEDVLRELVADIVREELTGALGERITRNVRKLVRQEINRALAARELD